MVFPKRFLIVLPFVLPGFAFAAPFLVSDPYGPEGPQPTVFEVTVDGRAERVSPAKHPKGGVYLRYDLKGLADGEHVIRVKAMNEKLQTESAEEEYRVSRRGDSWAPLHKVREKMGPSRTYPGYRGK